MSIALRFEQPGDGQRSSTPLRRLDVELLFAGAGERIELGATRILGLTPLRVEPACALESREGDEQRPRVHLEHAARDLFDAPGDAEAMHGLEAQRFEDEHVQRAGDDVGVHWATGDGRRATGDGMIDDTMV